MTWALTRPKTHQTRLVPHCHRSLGMPSIAVGQLRHLRYPEAFVFTRDPTGSVPIHPDRVTKVFTEARKSANVGSHVTFKGLRSYAATVIASAVGLVEAQAWLGHKDATTTARHYTARRAEDADRARAALDAAMTPKELDEAG